MNKTLLKRILSQPTAPFREYHVFQTIEAVLKQHQVPYFKDSVGNIILGVPSQKDYVKKLRSAKKEPLRLFIAHMDHPGFHGVKWISPRRLKVKWYGGSPLRHLNGAKVWLANSKDWVDEGTFSKARLNKRGTAIQEGEVLFAKDLRKENRAESLFGGFKFRAPVWERSNLIYTKAADDLVGAYSIVEMAIRLKKKGTLKSSPFIGLLTRAEEVGFIGAIKHFEFPWFKNAAKNILCVSLETSRTLPKAIIGKGPVIRLGDRSTVFDPSATQIFKEVAKKVLPKKHQARIMDGGTCEGTAALAFGYPVIAISIPLGNYHNQSFEGGPDSRGPNGPAPEFVHLEDVKGMLKLSEGILARSLPWNDPWKKTRVALQKHTRSLEAKLKG